MPSSLDISVEDISPSQGRVLVAEDNAALRDYLVSILRTEGYDVAEARTADDLVDTLAVSLRPDQGCGAFDLVIAEDRLVARGEPALGSGADLPPLVLIGEAGGRTRTGGRLASKAVARFGKPLDIDSLCSAVRSFSQMGSDSRQTREAIISN
jgi:CheY-like chemotaxis protein